MENQYLLSKTDILDILLDHCKFGRIPTCYSDIEEYKEDLYPMIPHNRKVIESLLNDKDWLKIEEFFVSKYNFSITTDLFEVLTKMKLWH